MVFCTQVAAADAALGGDRFGADPIDRAGKDVAAILHPRDPLRERVDDLVGAYFSGVF